MKQNRRPYRRIFKKHSRLILVFLLAFSMLPAFAGCRNTLIPSRDYMGSPQGGTGQVRLEILAGPQSRTVMPEFSDDGVLRGILKTRELTSGTCSTSTACIPVRTIFTTALPQAAFFPEWT